MLESLFGKVFKNTYFEEYLRTTASVLFFSWLSLPHVFSVQVQTEMVEEWLSENIYCQLYFPQNNHFLEIYFQHLFRWIKI